MKIIGLSNLALKAFKINNNKVVGNNSSRINETIINISKNNKSKNLIYMPNIRAMAKFSFLSLDVKKILNNLK